MKRTLLVLSISYILGLNAAVLADSTRVAPPLALAKVYKPNFPVEQYWVSEKMDGARAYWDGRRLLSRSGLVFHAPDWFTEGFPAQPLDGELWMGRGTFESLMRVVRDKIPDHSAWQRVHYWVFDMPSAEGTFLQRQTLLRSTVARADAAHLRLVEQRRFTEQQSLEQYLDSLIAAGAEGLMLQREDQDYRAGRHTGLLKLKRYVDAEARVIAYMPGKGKYHGLVGALLVEDTEGRQFRLGSGLSDVQRLTPPVLGSHVSYRYQGRTTKGLPRFARFIRVRPEE